MSEEVFSGNSDSYNENDQQNVLSSEGGGAVGTLPFKSNSKLRNDAKKLRVARGTCMKFQELGNSEH